MARQSIFDTAFDELHSEFNRSKKAVFLRDIQGQLEEDERIYAIVRKRRTERLFAVSFDRKLNDGSFSYSEFDLVLVAIDAICGGRGIRKPVNQMRVLRWNSSAEDLKTVLRYLGRLNPQIQPYSFLILPYPAKLVGHRIARSIYKS